MMQKLIVKNFGAIKEAEIEVPRFLVLTGEQASGKSTLAKLIYFFQTLRDDFFDKFVNLSEKKIEYEAIIHTFFTEITDRFDHLFKGIIKDNKVEINFFFNEKHNFYWNFQDGFNGNLEIYLSNTEFQEIISEFQKFKYPTNPREKIQYSKLFNSLQEKINEVASVLFGEALSYEPFVNSTKLSQNILYIPENRNITVSYSSQFQTYFNRQVKENDLVSIFMFYVAGLKDWFYQNKIENTFSQKINQILKGNYKIQFDHEELEIENGIKIPLNFASSGQKEVIRILQDMLYQHYTKKSFFRVIEEPEAHLFPNAQLDLIQILTYVTNQNKGNLVITTHSPYITVIFNYLCYAAKIMRLAKEKNLEDLLEKEFWNNPQFSFFDKDCTVEPENFRAYAIKNGVSESIFNEQDALFEEDLLDVSFEQLSVISEKLYALKGQILRHV